MKIKKITIVLVSLLILGLCLGLVSCELFRKTPSAKEISGKLADFESGVKIKYHAIEATASTQRDSGVCVITFTSPQSLSGLKITCKDESVKLSYMGISTTMTKDNFPGNSIVRMLLSSIDSIMKPSGIRIIAENNSLVISGTNDNGTEFTLTLDPQNQNLMKLSVPSEELEIEFINFKFLN